MGVKLVIFEDNEKLRHSLEAVLGSGEEYEICGAYGDVLTAGEIIMKIRPDVVILDIHLPRLDGISVIPVIKKVSPRTKVVMYTQFENEEKLFSSLCAGADGYILKKTSPLKLYEAIREVMQGGAPMSPAIAKKVLESFRKPAKGRDGEETYRLTRREKEVLKLLVQGRSVKFIASELHMAFETCRSHLRNIYQKLHVNCGKEAIAKILSERIRL